MIAMMGLLQYGVDARGPGPRMRLAQRPWVAEVVGRDPQFGRRREFVRATLDYRHASGAGARGVRNWFIIDPGKLYEVCEWTGKTTSRRYFVEARDGLAVELTDNEVQAWLERLSDHSASMC